MKRNGVYVGKIDHSVLPKVALRAYQTWKAQRQRCNNPKATSYRYWGNRGIKVEYSSREFIFWYLKEIKKFKGNDPVVGRIDHNKNYTLDNIEMVSRVENSKDSANRGVTARARKIKIIDKNTKITLAIVNGTLEAQKYTGINCGNISRYISGKYKSGKRINFIFELLK